MIKFLLLPALLIFTVLFISCSRVPKFTIDYCGQKDLYSNAKNSYEAGQTVVLYYDYFATDTNYSFYLNGKSLEYGLSNASGHDGFEIRFVMPACNAKLECVEVNSMEKTEQEKPPKETMLFDYYKPNNIGGHFEMVLNKCYNSENDHYYSLDVYTKQDAECEETCVSYYATYSAYRDCLDIAYEYGLYCWDILKENVTVDGDFIVCKYLPDNQQQVRVTTEKMPQNGLEAFNKIYSKLHSYINDDNIIE